jgi:glycosyltransferase involved in cell wall biosynthesis
MISICLPILNARQYLPERWQSICNQTFQEWDLIVCDSGSHDGSWEFLQSLSATDQRVSLHRVSREGIYAGINECIRRASGEVIYIATADDTMEPKCLEQLLGALQNHPECGIVQCALRIIDENGVSLPEAEQWERYTLGMYDPKLVSRPNKRMAPHDGLLHPGLLTIYTSLTQLLIRKSVFDRCGLFDGRWGAISDFEWGMRVGLLENCVYIPEKLATWRHHATQATDHADTYVRREKMLQMVHAAFEKSVTISGGGVRSSWSKLAAHILERDLIQMRIQEWRSGQCMIGLMLQEIFLRPLAFMGHLKDELLNKHWGQWHHGNRYRMISRLLKKCMSPQPVFLDSKQSFSPARVCKNN